MIQTTTAEPILPESLPTPAGCQLCRQKIEDLVAAALAYYSARPHPDGATPAQIEHEIREGKPRRYCEDCGRRIPQYHSMQNCGFQSQTLHHHHEQPIDKDRLGRTYQIPVHRELCHDCYLVDHQVAYPDAPVPQIANARFD